MASSHEKLNQGTRAGLDRASEHLPALTRAYGRALRAAGRRAAAKFRQIETVTAAGSQEPPGWVPPPTGELINGQELADDTEKKTGKLHRLILTAAGTEAATSVGISFDIKAPTSQAILDAYAARIQATIQSAIAEQVTEAIQTGYTTGQSVTQVSSAIQQATDSISRVRADMLARSDLNGIANAGSHLAATISGAASTKTWTTAGDDKVRDDHADADGQTVAIDQPFDVGGESAMYPGDPNLSWDESANCRCVLTYGNPLTASGAKPSDFASWADYAWEGEPSERVIPGQGGTLPLPRTDDGSLISSASPGILYLARHGLTEYDSDDHARDTIRGWADDPLNDEGVAEARRLADNLKGHSISQIQGSDLQRAAKTMDIIADAIGVSSEETDALRPWNLGDFQGRTSDDARDDIAWSVDHPDETVPNGESFNAFCSRFLPAVSEAMSAAEQGASPLLVTHSHNLKLARAWIRNNRQPVDGDAFMEPSPGPASVLAFDPARSWTAREILCDGEPTSVNAADAVTSGGNMNDFALFKEAMNWPVVLREDIGVEVVLAATGDTGLPLSERDRAWDAGAAGGRVKKWASSDGSGDPDKIDYGKLARAYFWQMPAGTGGPALGDFKLPFADIIGGKLTAVWRGVTAGAARLSQTDGIDKAAVQKKMASYYSKAAKTYSDPSIKPPWASGSAATDGETLALIRAHLADQGADVLEDDELRAIMLAVSFAQPAVGVDEYREALGLPDRLLAAAEPGTPWQATLCIANQPTVDSGIKRLLVQDGGSWRPLPLPLALLDDSPHADMTSKAPIVGRIDQIWWAGNVCQASGVFFDASDDPMLAQQASKAAALVDEMRRLGISVDLVDCDVELCAWSGGTVISLDDANDPTAHQDMVDPNAPGGPATEGNLPNDIPDMDDEPDPDDLEEPEYVMAFQSWVIAGATICPVQALTDATISLVAGGEEVLTAAAAGLAPLEPPADWFENPNLGAPTPLTVTDDGQVYGHMALWETCHTGRPGVCVTPPHSPSSYRHFHRGQVKTAEGDRVDVGILTMNTGHAGLRAGAKGALAHYDDTGTQAAHVRAGEDEFGIWLAGAVNPTLSAEDARLLMASTPSGDWRELTRGEGLDMFGVLAVNVPGFPVPRTSSHLVAAGTNGWEQDALVAAGIVEVSVNQEEFARELAILAASADGIEGLAALVEA